MSPLTNEQLLGRAKNALLSFFEQRLSVPKIYLDADWEGQKVDVLAIDRAGVGDVSIALSRPPSMEFDAFVKKLHAIPAHFKYWIGVRTGHGFVEEPEESRVYRPDHPILFAEDGVGRIGQIVVDLSGGKSVVSIPIPSERFRSTQNIYDLADSFATSHTADFEVRP